MPVDVKIDLAACTRCGICDMSCPQDVILTERDGTPKAIYLDDCTGCRLCQVLCPVEAIRVIGGTSWKYDDTLMMQHFLKGLEVRVPEK
jgi:2-oxoglutarate ferredoxin oxidoreductase subunit delta